MKNPTNPDQSSNALAHPSDAESQPAGAARRIGVQRAPRSVIRGESNTKPFKKHLNTAPFSALTDWLNVTFPASDENEVLDHFKKVFLEIVGNDFSPILDRGKGHLGWKTSFSLGHSKAILGVGGQKGRVLLSLPGFACNLIHNETWPHIVDILEYYGARITRWDGAVDDFEGKHSVTDALLIAKNGGFNSGGNKPSVTQNGDWDIHRGKGRTLNVGARKNGKFMRIYEKGKHLGDPDSKWVRHEVEFHNVDREIPFDVLLYPEQYVAGSYPCMAWISEEACRIRTLKASAKISYKKLIEHAKRTYGPLINVMLEVEDNPKSIIDLLVRDGIPNSLRLPNPPSEAPEPPDTKTGAHSDK